MASASCTKGAQELRSLSTNPATWQYHRHFSMPVLHSHTAPKALTLVRDSATTTEASRLPRRCAVSSAGVRRRYPVMVHRLHGNGKCGGHRGGAKRPCPRSFDAQQAAGGGGGRRRGQEQR